MALQLSNLIQKPQTPFDMAYGPNPITLSGIDTIDPIPDKYALRIFLLGNPIPIADIRQTPNRLGVAIFDAQNVLQSYIGPSKYDIDGLFAGSFVAASRPLHIADGELIEYQISFNYEHHQQSILLLQVLNNTMKYHLMLITIDLK